MLSKEYYFNRSPFKRIYFDLLQNLLTYIVTTDIKTDKYNNLK